MFDLLDCANSDCYCFITESDEELTERKIDKIETANETVCVMCVRMFPLLVTVAYTRASAATASWD